MRILATGDIHIHNWSEFSTIDEYGRPDRLTNYLKLADGMCKVGRERNVDAIFLAGDIIESAVNRPQVLEVLRRFLTRLAREFPVHVIHGQHDMDVKIADTSEHNSILTTVSTEFPNLHYYPDPKTVDIGGLRVHFQSWRQELSLFEPDTADIFVGHGIVPGSSTPQNYVFNKGSFEKDNLLSAFRLSVIGDVHRRHWASTEDGMRHVLVPGAPVQNTWKDDPECGFWVVDVGDEVRMEYLETHDVIPDTFHKFLYANMGDKLEKSPLVHYHINALKKKKEEGKLSKGTGPLDLLSAARELLTKGKKVNVDQKVNTFEQFLSHVKQDDKAKPEVVVNGVSIRNFLSIDSFDFDFDSIQGNNCVIVGENGSGKTNLPEAIYWCLTGKTTKSTKVADLANWDNPKERMSVTVRLRIGEQNFKIDRSRIGSSPDLRRFVETENGWVDYKGGDMRQTDREIAAMTGLTHKDIMLFSYFSAEDPIVYGKMGDAERNDIIAQIGGFDLSKVHSSIKDQLKTSERRQFHAEGTLQEVEHGLENKKRALRGATSNMSNDSNALAIIAGEQRGQLEELEEEAKKFDKQNLIQQWTRLSNQIQEIKTFWTARQNKKASLHEELKGKQQQMRAFLLDSKCYVCGSVVTPPEDKMAELKASIAKLLSEIEEQDHLVEDDSVDIPTLEKEQKKVNKSLDKSTKIQREIESTRKALADTEGRMDVNTRAVLDLLRREIADLLERQIQAQQKYKEEEGKVDVLTDLVALTARSGQLVKHINSHSSEMMQGFIDDATSGMMVDFRLKSNYTIEGKFRGQKRFAPYDSMSFGQKRVADITMMVALNNLFCSRFELSKGILGLCVYDEVLSFLDDERTRTCKEIVSRSRAENTIVISHDTNLAASFQTVITVTMKDGRTRYHI